MHNLKFSRLILVGRAKEKEYFEKYFREVKLLDDNREVFKFYNKNSFSTIFLDCDSKKSSAIDICKKIREDDRDTVIVLLADFLDRNRLEEAIPLHLSGCIQRPFKKKRIESVLFDVEHDLELLSTDITKLKNGYHFSYTHQILYDSFHCEVKLTKNELKLLNVLIRAKDEFVDAVSIEHDIWADSDNYDCTNRLKNLLYNLRKKLPNSCILNSYDLGYKLVHV